MTDARPAETADIDHFRVTRLELLSRVDDAADRAAVAKDLDTWPPREDLLDLWVIDTAWRIEWTDVGGETRGCMLGDDPDEMLHSEGDFESPLP